MLVKASAAASSSAYRNPQRTAGFLHETPLAIKRKLFLDNAIIYYAQLYFNTHRRGLLGRKISLNHMLTWSKVLNQPLDFILNSWLGYSTGSRWL